MQPESVIEQARAAGFTHVQTFGPLVALDAWRPYGRRPEEATSVTFHLDGDAIAERGVRPVEAPFMLGRWPLVRA